MSRNNRNQSNQFEKIRERHYRYGWRALFLFMSLGLFLESLLGFKAEFFLLDSVKREFWRLSHSHGTLLSLVNLLYASWLIGERRGNQELVSKLLLGGLLLLPLGFFLGGFSPAEGDPGIGILLVPIGAILLLGGVGLIAWSSGNDR